MRTYTGSTEPPFKQRLSRHRSDTSNCLNRHKTALVGWYFKKKDAGVGVNINNYRWEIVKKCFKYQPGGKKCDLCLTEKLMIMKNKDPRSLNKRTELMNPCRHRWRHKLQKVPDRQAS